MTPDMNLRKLVSLEVHDRLGNAKIAKKYFLMSKWGVPYRVGNLKRRAQSASSYIRCRVHTHRHLHTSLMANPYKIETTMHMHTIKRRAEPEFKPSPIHSSTLSRLD